jgi:hypothetical protein
MLGIDEIRSKLTKRQIPGSAGRDHGFKSKSSHAPKYSMSPQYEIVSSQTSCMNSPSLDLLKSPDGERPLARNEPIRDNGFSFHAK